MSVEKQLPRQQANGLTGEKSSDPAKNTNGQLTLGRGCHANNLVAVLSLLLRQHPPTHPPAVYVSLFFMILQLCMMDSILYHKLFQ